MYDLYSTTFYCAFSIYLNMYTLYVLLCTFTVPSFWLVLYSTGTLLNNAKRYNNKTFSSNAVNVLFVLIGPMSVPVTA